VSSYSVVFHSRIVGNLVVTVALSGAFQSVAISINNFSSLVGPAVVPEALLA